MARGITSEDVSRTADDLLAAGERPTAERVRLALGRGSPNTIGPMLESWWSALAQRLRSQLALPEVPAELGSAFAQVWAQALAAGQAHAENLVAPERAALAEVLARTEAAAATHQSALATKDAQLQHAEATARTLEAVLAASDRRVGELQAELSALSAKHEGLSRQRDALDERLVALQAKADAERTAAASERDRLQGLLRQVEDRAYGEVDRARQEMKGLRSELANQKRDHAAALRATERARNTAATALAKAQHDLAVLRARVGAKAPARAARKPPTKMVRSTAERSPG